MATSNGTILNLATDLLKVLFPDLTPEKLYKAIMTNRNNETSHSPTKIFRRKDLKNILGISLREVDRLIAPQKRGGHIVAPAKITAVQLGPRAVGVLESDLKKFLDKSRRTK